MPGFMIHLAEAEMIMDYMDTKPTSEWAGQFLLGNLLPDTKLGEQKSDSHFWNPEYAGQLARAPELSRFLNKYGHRLEEPAVLGYYAHLYLDRAYVKTYWPKIFVFEDQEGCPKVRKDQIVQVELKGRGKVIPYDQFFSGAYYYGDYTRSNSWFINRYHIRKPEYMELKNLNMSEVCCEDLHKVLDEIEYLCRLKGTNEENNMEVFDPADLENFVLKTAESFYTHISHLLNL